MPAADHVLTPEAIATVGSDWRALALVALDDCPGDTVLGALPPFPVIGIGDPAHPLAGRLDAIVEPPVTVAGLVRSIEEQPHAAALLVQLLRSMDGLEPRAALTVESQGLAVLQGSAAHADWLAARPSPMAAEPGSVIVARQGATLDVAIDRAWAHNAIDRAVRDDLHEAFTVAATDPDIAAVVWRGAGRVFSIGADLAEFGTTRDPATAHLIRMRTLPALPLLDCADRLTVHVRGGCVGAGLEMAAFARTIVARRDAWFQLPELAMGIIPGAGGCVSVPRRIGRQRAALMMLSGRRIGVATALRWGLIDRIEDTAAADEGGAHQR